MDKITKINDLIWLKIHEKKTIGGKLSVFWRQICYKGDKGVTLWKNCDIDMIGRQNVE